MGLKLREPGRLVPHLLRQQIQSVPMLRERLPRFVSEFTQLRSKIDQRLQR
jgi:hypothetical protein